MSAITRVLVLSSILITLAACGEKVAAKDPFEGRFTTTFQGAPVQLTLKRDGSTVRMEFSAGGRTQTINAAIDGNVATGTFTDPQVAGEARATLEAKDADHMKLTLVARNAHGGENSVPFEFTREAPAAATGGSTSAGGATSTSNVERDPAILGVWRQTRSYTSGEFTMASDTFMTFRADGTFRHGDTNMAGGNSGSSVESRGGEAVEGQWKTQNRQLYARTDASQPWELAARYYVEGNKLLATLPSGEKELWTRIR